MKHHRLISRRPLLAQDDGGTGGGTDGTGTGGTDGTGTGDGGGTFSGSNFAVLKNFLVEFTDQMVQWVFRKTI